MKKITSVLLVIVFLALVAYAQSYGDDEVGFTASPSLEEQRVVERKANDAPSESKEDRLERMLSAFDRGNYQKGMLVVSFRDGTTKDDVVELFEEYGLILSTERVCGPEIPEEPGAKCTLVDRWNEDLLTATAGLVPVGEEKSMAQRLMNEEIVVWVEPEIIATLAEEVTEPIGPLVAQDLASVVEGKQKLVILTIVGVILILLVLYFIFRRKKTVV